MTADPKTYACVADAVAHYFDRGFVSGHGEGDTRVMENAGTGQAVRIQRVGFMTVQAVTYPIEP